MDSREKMIFHRRRAGLTQSGLAKALGSTRSMISKLELGERKISAGWRKRLADVFGLTPEDLEPSENGLDDLPADERDLVVSYRLMTASQKEAFRVIVKASRAE